MSELLSHRDGELLILTLNRPDRRNALTLELVRLLGEELDRAAQDDALRAVVLVGAGSQAFSAGMDLGQLKAHLSARPGGEAIRKLQRHLQEAFTRLEELEKPVIAAIEGACVGGGLELALACDLRVASTDARFGFPEVKLGMIPDLGGTVRLARLVGPSLAKEWILTGRQYPASRAFELGLVNELVPPGEALDRARAIALELAANAPIALAWAKRVIDRSLGTSLRDGLELEQDAMTELLPSADLEEGVAAFLEKRPPRFRGNRRSSGRPG